ncbi:uncharacterized protein LOC135473440 [Liolophura sinensis]|uniref:uncharacterized protein LOC135473440 n=1 Tax=Liolophura sinensis TaxID=3198878 RepID=UPI003158C120
MADEDSTEQTSLQIDPDTEEETPEPKTRREKLGVFLQSNPVQYGILALVIIDVVIVILEILIDFEMIVIPENEDTSLSVTGSSSYFNNSTVFDAYHVTTSAYHMEPHALKAEHDQSNHEIHHDVHSPQHDYGLSNHSDHYNSSDHHDDHGGHHGSGHHHSNKETVEHILHYSSLTILAIFVVEVFCKLIAEGLHFFKHKAEVFDATIVLVSFSMDIAFSFVTVTSAARDATGLMVVLRLWRVTRIINGVIMSVKKDADKKINEQKAARVKAEEEVERMRGRIETLQKEVNTLKKKLKNHEPSTNSCNPGSAGSTNDRECNSSRDSPDDR